jgi:hypothetical protein
MDPARHHHQQKGQYRRPRTHANILLRPIVPNYGQHGVAEHCAERSDGLPQPMMQAHEAYAERTGTTSGRSRRPRYPRMISRSLVAPGGRACNGVGFRRAGSGRAGIGCRILPRGDTVLDSKNSLQFCGITMTCRSTFERSSQSVSAATSVAGRTGLSASHPPPSTETSRKLCCLQNPGRGALGRLSGALVSSGRATETSEAFGRMEQSSHVGQASRHLESQRRHQPLVR